MTHTVKLLPSGHRFTVEGREPIIDAGLREGINMGRGCASGNCGACKARVATGEVRQTQPYDYVFSEAEKAAGFILTCSYTAASDLVLECAEAGSADDIPYQEIRSAVRRIERPGEGKMLLHLKTPRTQTLRFLAGQRVSLSTPEGLQTHLPVASCPCDGRNLLFVLHDRRDDPFMRHVFDHLAPSQNLIVSGPYGDFSLRDDGADPLVFVAFDLGIAPVKSLIEQAMALDTAPRMDLYRTDSSDGRGYLDRLWRSWQDALETFHYSSLPPETSPEQMLERIAADLPGLSDADCYVAGPSSIVERFTTLAPDYGLELSRLRWDVVS